MLTKSPILPHVKSGLRAVFLACAFVVACGGDQPRPQQQKPLPPQTQAAPPRALPVEIVSISPETIDVRGGRAVPTEFTIEYRIANPEKVSEAEVRIESSGFGVLQRQPVPVQPSGVVTMVADLKDDFGPIVRLRAVCPAGTTEWRQLGVPRDPDASSEASGVTLTSVSPTEIKPSYTGDAAGAARIGLHGSGFSADCKIEAERDGSPVEIANTYFRDRALTGLLRHYDIDSRPVARRYLDFGVSIRGPGVGQINLKRVPFNE